MPRKATPKPDYRPPRTFTELTKPIPRVVNEAWIVLALRENVAAARAGEFLPWDDQELQRRAAAIIERLADIRVERRPHVAAR